MKFHGRKPGSRPWLVVFLGPVVCLTLIAAVVQAARTVEVRADVLIARDAGQIIEAQGHVSITDGRSMARAGRAVYFVRDRRIELSGAVMITTPQGDFEARQAIVYLDKTNALASVDASGSVVVEAQQRVLKADRVSYEAASGNMIATGHVSLFVPPDLVASGAELITKGREVATLTGRARVQNRDGYIEGDRLEVQERPQTAYVRGNVVSVFQEIRITSEAATLLAKEGKAIFRDRVTVSRPGRTLNADQVTLYYKEKRFVAEGTTQIRIEEERERP